MGGPMYYNGKFVPFLDGFVSYKGELFAIAKDEDGLNYTLYQASGGFRKRLAIKMKRKIDLNLAIESEKLGIRYMKDDGSGKVFVPLPV